VADGLRYAAPLEKIKEKIRESKGTFYNQPVKKKYRSLKIK